MKHFSSGEKLINKALSHKNTPERQTVELSSAHYFGHIQATCVGGTKCAYPARHGETIIPCLSQNSSRFLPLFKKKKKKKIHVLSILISFLIIPTNTWMAFNNLLAFQLLNMSQVSRGTRCRRSPRGKPGQLT